jgi:kumamolisin
MISDRKVAGSHRTPLRGAKIVGTVDPNQRIEVSVRVCPRTRDLEWEKRMLEMSSKLPIERSYLTRENLAAVRGADPEVLAKVEVFAHANHLTVLDSSIPKRTVRLAGKVADFCHAFGVQLRKYGSKNVTYRGRSGFVYVPKELEEVVEGVFGLDNRRLGRPHFRRPPIIVRAKAGNAKKAGARTKPISNRKLDSGFSVPEVAQIYNFPADLDGAGQCIALIELNSFDKPGNITGGGYSISDLQAFFRNLKRPIPDVSAIGVSGGANMPGIDQTGDSEVTLDIDVVGAVAPRAKIAVYFAPDTDAGFIDAVNTALHDTLRKPSVISISWGNPEDDATDQFLKVLNEIFQDAAALGVTVCCETGDYGAPDEPVGSRDGQPHVEFPASSPFVLACGGTKLIRSGKKISGELVWNDGDKGGAGGGGVSNKFPRPLYQTTTTIPLSPQRRKGRGLPDVAGNAVGYGIIVKGIEIPAGGTSAVAPLWAGLIAIINQSLAAEGSKPVGFLNPLIYGEPAITGAFNDIVQGNNDIDGKLNKYSARSGWDPCSGMGSPNGVLLLQALKPLVNG